jgi:hypothetical protein
MAGSGAMQLNVDCEPWWGLKIPILQKCLSFQNFGLKFQAEKVLLDPTSHESEIFWK